MISVLTTEYKLLEDLLREQRMIQKKTSVFPQ